MMISCAGSFSSVPTKKITYVSSEERGVIIIIIIIVIIIILIIIINNPPSKSGILIAIDFGVIFSASVNFTNLCLILRPSCK